MDNVINGDKKLPSIKFIFQPGCKSLVECVVECRIPIVGLDGKVQNSVAHSASEKGQEKCDPALVTGTPGGMELKYNSIIRISFTIQSSNTKDCVESVLSKVQRNIHFYGSLSVQVQYTQYKLSLVVPRCHATPTTLMHMNLHAAWEAGGMGTLVWLAIS